MTGWALVGRGMATAGVMLVVAGALLALHELLDVSIINVALIGLTWIVLDSIATAISKEIWRNWRHD